MPRDSQPPQRPKPSNVDRRSLLLGSALIASGAPALTACGRSKSGATEEGVCVVVPTLRSTWIRNFNPYFESQARWPTCAGIYEPTIIFNRATGMFVPWLAERWYWNEDNTRLTLEIRDGATFSDGKPLTAGDVLFTFQLMKKHRALDQFAVWKHTKAISREGSKVHFDFNYPYTLPALFIIGKQPIVPAHIWKNIDDPVKFPNKDPIGSGPFNQIVTFKSQLYEVGANPNYWQKGKPGIKKFRVPAFGGNEAQALSLIRGEIDWGAAFIPAIDRIFISKDPKRRGYFFPSLEGTVMLYANTVKKPYDQPNVRKALSHAIDRKMIVRIALQGYTRTADATGFSDLYKKYHDPKVLEEEGDWTIYDPKKAGEMLDAAGLKMGKNGHRTMPDGSPWVVDLNCVAGWGDWTIASEIMVKNLRAIGIDATLRTYAFGAWFEALQLGNFQLSISWSDGAATPYSFYQRQMSSDTYFPVGELAENNWQRFASKKADKLLVEFASTSDEKRQWEISSELQREFVRHAPAIPLFPGPTWGQFTTKRIEGFPSKENPYAPLAPYKAPGQLLTMVELRPAGTPPLSDAPGTGAEVTSPQGGPK